MKKQLGAVISIFAVMLSLCSCGWTNTAGNKESASNGAVSSSAVSEPAVREKYEFTDKPVKFDEIAWSAFQEKMPADEYADLLEYKAALMSENTINWTESIGLFLGERTFQQAWDDFDEEYGCEDKDRWIDWVMLGDLTGDGQKELVLCTSRRSPEYIIIHIENGKFYGIALASRSFWSPQQSGCFYQGKGDIGNVSRLSFENGEFSLEILASFRTGPQTKRDVFAIGGEEVDERTYNKWIKENMTGEIPKYDPAQIS